MNTTAATTLTTLATLGFAAASGLVAAHDALWVIADDGLQLQQLSLQGEALASHALFPGRAALPDEPKARKKPSLILKPFARCPMAACWRWAPARAASACSAACLTPQP